MKFDELKDNELIEVEVSYAPFDRQSALSYYFTDWDEAIAFVRLSMSHSFVVQISISDTKE